MASEQMGEKVRAVGIAGVYIGCVIGANWLTVHYGLVPIGFGLSVTAGTFAAGATLLARNVAQDLMRRLFVVALMLIGCVLSWWLAAPFIAVASGVSFALSESADMAVFTPLRKRGWARAAIAAAAVSSVVDTLAFLHLAHFPVTPSSALGQVLVKLGISAIAALIGGSVAVLRQPIDIEGA